MSYLEEISNSLFNTPKQSNPIEDDYTIENGFVVDDNGEYFHDYEDMIYQD